MADPNKTIAIIGASNNRRKYGNIAVRAYVDQDFTVYPVNPNEETIEGLQCYPSVKDIPGEVETISVYLTPHKTLEVLEDIAAKNPDLLFLNPGSESEEVINQALELGLNPVQACSVLAVGKMPSEYGP